VHAALVGMYLVIQWGLSVDSESGEMHRTLSEWLPAKELSIISKKNSIATYSKIAFSPGISAN